MYIEDKSEGLSGPARIGRVTFSKTGQTLYYQGRTFASLKGNGYKANYYDVDSGEHFWISGCKKSGVDALYSNTVTIDEDVLDEYWVEIRNKPEMIANRLIKGVAKYSRG